MASRPTVLAMNVYDQQGPAAPAAAPSAQYTAPADNYYDYDPYGDYYDEEGEEEMPTERELAEDAQWKLIQKNTFTRWANEHLKLVNKNIADLEFDLSDGLRLVALVEVLSGKKFSKLNRRPNFRTQKLENVTMCLRFLEEDEGIKIVNIGELFVTRSRTCISRKTSSSVTVQISSATRNLVLIQHNKFY